ncbi:MAG: phosphodiester glycosidase family protein, partial [Candidatus Eisenbacteria bacterium]
LPVVLLLVLLGATSGPAAPPSHAGKAAALSVWRSGAWHPWWRADRAPERWSAPDTLLTHALDWKRLAPGLEWATLRLSCPAPAWGARLIVARLDPRKVTLSLTMAMTRDQRPAWSIDSAPEEAILAVNAGQFVGGMPWGWVTIDGRQLLRPGAGPLSTAIAVDAAGRVHWAHGGSTPTAAPARLGFQSYPTLLSGDGVVPASLRTGQGGLNLTHRDARLAVGETRDGMLLVVLTRFDALGEFTGSIPLGPTTPEMAAIMGALGARDAAMLDGGISAQLLLRDPARRDPLRWPGWRKVPLALIARPNR